MQINFINNAYKIHPSPTKAKNTLQTNKQRAIGFSGSINSALEKELNSEVDKFVYSTGQKLDPKVHFKRMKGYGEYLPWAKEMNSIVYQISDMISSDCDFETIMDKARKRIRKINHGGSYCELAEKHANLHILNYFRIWPHDRGHEYLNRERLKTYMKIDELGMGSKETKSNEEYKDASTTKIVAKGLCDIRYGRDKGLKNLEFVKQEYEKLKSIKNPTKEQIVSSCATIQWLIAQETPFIRGSDSFASVLTKSIFHAYGIEISPLKKGIGFDFEAFFRDLDDYIEAYPTFFEKEPDFIQKG